MKAMILAAGEGTRLRPLTLALPKPMIAIANKPLLVRTIKLLESQGIVEIAVNLYHRADSIRSTLGDGSMFGVRLHYSDEAELGGTAGGVKRMAAFLDEPFLVLYGDNLYYAEFQPLIDFHRQNKALATIATFEASNPSACGLVVADADGRVERFQEKPPPAEVFTNCANAGVYVLDPAVHGFIPSDGPSDFGKDVFPALLTRASGSVYARPLDGYLRDTGTMESYRQANWDVIDGRISGQLAESGVSPDAWIAPDARVTGRNCIGANSEIQSGAEISESVLWDGVFVGEHARVTGAILGRNVWIGAHATITAGAVIADGAHIPAGVTVPRDSRVGPGEIFRAD